MMSTPDGNMKMKSLTYQSTLFPAPATETKIFSLEKSHKEMALTDVSHEPIEGNPVSLILSISNTCRPEGTMRQTRGGVTCRQCCGSSMGRAVTAIFEYPVPTCRLPENISDSGQQSRHQ